MITIEDAICLAANAHKGQKDLEGSPYILHPLRVGMMGQNYEEMVTGFLHDVVEDTDISFSQLEEKGVSDEVIAALKLLTRNDGETYWEYVERIARSDNKLALRVKLNDLSHNLERGKKYGHFDLVKKHERAYEYLVKLLKGEKDEMG